jgi:UDP-glucose 4-epimerase
LGTGRGISVLQLLHAMEKAIGRKIPYKIAPRRPGDVGICVASVEKAKRQENFILIY